MLESKIYLLKMYFMY